MHQCLIQHQKKYGIAVTTFKEIYVMGIQINNFVRRKNLYLDKPFSIQELRKAIFYCTSYQKQLVWMECPMKFLNGVLIGYNPFCLTIVQSFLKHWDICQLRVFAVGIIGKCHDRTTMLPLAIK